MAQSRAQLDRELLSCSLCLDLLKEPVTLSCGHGYCRQRLQDHWHLEEREKIYSCPHCRRTFTTRPVLEKNTMLAALLETPGEHWTSSCSRQDFHRNPRQITLDPNTANKCLLLSEENSEATFIKKVKSSGHPDRFTYNHQVLSRESLTGRCYWEVEWTGGGLWGGVGVAVNYNRDAKESKFGLNDKSWSLDCYSGGRLQFQYDAITTDVSDCQSSWVGVYLDYRASLLSFYGISNRMELPHRVKTNFTEPLRAGLWVYTGSSAELIKLFEWKLFFYFLCVVCDLNLS